MSNQHLVAIDLDGTLLRNDKTISDRTKHTIEKVRELGHHVMISTGRPYRASKIYYQELQLTTPIVNFNGAYIHHPLDESFGVFHTPLDLEVARKIFSVCEKLQVNNILAEIKDDVFLHVYDEKILEIVSMGNPITQTGDLMKALPKGPTSVLIHPEAKTVEEVKTELGRIFQNEIDMRTWGAPWHVIEIVKAGINKAVGVRMVADYYNIPEDRVITFGDEDNDLEMIAFAGYGVAMENAIQEIKNVAKYNTTTNEEDGVAQFLEEKFNIEPNMD